MPKSAHFRPDLFQFLVELKFHNERPWFQENKPRYEAFLKRPMLEFIADLAAPLKKVNPAYLADPRPQGGSLFRIYRDTRFARDKTPYKTHAAAHFLHRRVGRDHHTPAFYLHLEPGESFAAAGIWQPESEPLKRIRNFIVHRPLAWRKVKATGLGLWGEDSLKRPPKGFDPEHPFLEDLKRRHFILWADFTDRQVFSPGFLDLVVKAYRRMNPLVLFLEKALGM